MKQPRLSSLIILFATLAGSAFTKGETAPATSQGSSYHPAVNAFFESKDPYVQKVVLPNIEANRKSNVVLKITGPDGRPLAGVAVSAVLKKHDFLIGHCDLATERDPEKRRLLNEIFHYTCTGSVSKWSSNSKQPGESDFSKADAVVNFCRDNDIAYEWHFLSGYHPDWLQTIASDSEKARHQNENARTVLKRYQDRVQFFQVINEDWLTHIDRAKVYTDQTAWFSALRREFPKVQLGVCDCWSFDPKSHLPGVDELKKRYPGINFIAMHAHNPRQLWASPKQMYQTFDPYLDSGIEIHITEFGIILGKITGDYRSGEWDEGQLAEYFVQAMATAFSHRAVRVFNLWSNYEKFTGNPLFTQDGQPNEKYRAIKSLLHDKLTTRASGSTDPSGRYPFRGFNGTYDFTIKFPSGKESTVRAKIGGKASELKLSADEKTGTVKLEPR